MTLTVKQKQRQTVNQMVSKTNVLNGMNQYARDLGVRHIKVVTRTHMHTAQTLLFDIACTILRFIL